MRLAADDSALRARLGEAAAGKIGAEFSPAAIGARMAARLGEIRAELEGS
jgi:hypothetical protein